MHRFIVDCKDKDLKFWAKATNSMLSLTTYSYKIKIQFNLLPVSEIDWLASKQKHSI